MSISFIYPQYLWLLLLVPLTAGLGWHFSSRLRLASGLILRSVLLIAIVFALAGIQLRLRTDTLTTVFILDASDSIPPAERAKGETLIRQAIEAMPPGDRAAIVLFGEDALVERLASEEKNLPALTSVPITTRTDIASALQLAQAILPGEGAKRLVLLSDGRENLGQALEQAQIASSNKIELLFSPLGSPQGEVEVLVDSLEAPPDVRQGQDFTLTANIDSTARVNAALRLFEDGALVQTKELSLQPGANRIQMEVLANSSASTQESGFRRFRVQILPDADTRLQNNEASAFTIVHGPPKILIVEGQPGEGDNLARVLGTAGMQVTQLSPSAMPSTLVDLAGYEAVVLVDVNAADLPHGAMESLPVYVRDLGMGLLMVGGKDSFGAGGYLRSPLEKALPVNMEVKDKELQANLALVLAVDKSGSMGRCHCDNPDLSQSYTPRQSGQPKVDIAKEAIMRAASALGDQDYLGVVAFDSAPHWVLKLNPLVSPSTLEQSISAFQANGQTNIQAGLQAAYQALQNVPARRKHIILMTDGWVREGDLTPLAAEMNKNGVTLSIVAAGQGSAQYLAALSQIGGGSYYPATDILSVPDIFLKETVKSVGQYIIEEPFYPLPSAPSAVLSGLDPSQMPPLLGYNGTTAKNTAREDLITPRGDPLLATWQYGLGRSATWTSDLKGQWASQWLAWGGFSRFTTQLVNWILPTPKAEGLTASASLDQGQAVIRLEAVDKSGQPRNFLNSTARLVGPDLKTTELELKQVGAGQYQGSVPLSTPGTYLVRLGVNQADQSLGQMRLGLVVPYSPEYKASGIDRGLLGKLASLTGGGELAAPAAAFIHNLPSADTAREIWQPLLLLVALLFPLDVAIRRLMLGPADFRKARLWLAEHRLSGRYTLAERPRTLGALFEARQRARRRPSSSMLPPQTDLPPEVRAATVKQYRPGEPPPAPAPPVATGSGTSPSAPPQEQSSDSITRLHEAKKRARR